MIKKHRVLLLSLLIVFLFLFIQILLLLLLSLTKFSIKDYVVFTIDLSFIICVFLGNKLFTENNCIKISKFQKNNYYLFSLLFMVLWFFISPLFQINNSLDTLNFQINISDFTEKIYQGSFFDSYKLIRMLLFVPILEEIFYRKMIFMNLLKNYGLVFSSVISSMLFSIGHLDFNNFIVFLVYGIILSISYEKTNNLYFIILLHILVNFLSLIFV